VGFEPAIPASERAKTVHALDRAATETDSKLITLANLPRRTKAPKNFNKYVQQKKKKFSSSNTDNIHI
jgi:hypothetical protein